MHTLNKKVEIIQYRNYAMYTRFQEASYYKWLKRKGTINRYEEEQQELDYFVMDIHSHYPSQGYRTIADTLLNTYGWKVSDLSVWKSMKRLNITGYVRKST